MAILDNFDSQFINDVNEFEHGLMGKYDKIKLDSLSLDDIQEIYDGLDEINEEMIPQVIYGIKIDSTNPDPDIAVEYTDDAAGFIPLKVDQSTGICNYGSWENVINNFFGIYPCIVKSNGSVIFKLDPNNYNQTIDGKPIDIESGDFGQVMIRFKKIYYKFTVDENIISFQVSNKKVDHTWIDNAFCSEDGIGTVKDEMFIAAYESTLKNNRLQSVSNAKPEVKLELHNFFNSSRFDVFSMINITRKQFITFLGYLVTKSINLEDNIGSGNTSGELLVNGSMNNKGLFYGTNTTTDGVKMFGIENLWGNQLKYMNGIVQKLTYVLDSTTGMTVPEQHLYIKDFYPYNKIEDFIDAGRIDTDYGYISSLKFLSNSIYFPDNLNGSSSTYFKSYFRNGKEIIPRIIDGVEYSEVLYGLYGGNNTYGDKCGPECLLLGNLDPMITDATTHIIY